MMSVIGITRFLPSNVVTLIVFPVRASKRVIRFVKTKSFPSRLNVSCGFSSITNIRSPAAAPGSWFPFSGNVIFVPFFQPGLMCIVKISSRVPGFLQLENCMLSIQ
ncbi:hypothetical protein Hanom_Chr16g01418211 [Helianthus anomalus]